MRADGHPRLFREVSQATLGGPEDAEHRHEAPARRRP